MDAEAHGTDLAERALTPSTVRHQGNRIIRQAECGAGPTPRAPRVTRPTPDRQAAPRSAYPKHERVLTAGQGLDAPGSFSRYVSRAMPAAFAFVACSRPT